MEKLDKSVYWMLDEKQRRNDDRRDILIISILVTILAGCILTLVVLLKFTHANVQPVTGAISNCLILYPSAV